MKKILALVLLLSILLLAACSVQQDTSGLTEEQENLADQAAEEERPFDPVVEETIVENEINQELVDPAQEVDIGEMI